MKQLEKTITWKGFVFRQVKRTDKAAIYEQHHPRHGLIAFETWKVVSHDGITLGGQFISARETVPGEAAFGLTAWSYALFGNKEGAFAKAESKFTELNEKPPNLTPRSANFQRFAEKGI